MLTTWVQDLVIPKTYAYKCLSFSMDITYLRLSPFYGSHPRHTKRWESPLAIPSLSTQVLSLWISVDSDARDLSDTYQIFNTLSLSVCVCHTLPFLLQVSPSSRLALWRAWVWNTSQSCWGVRPRTTQRSSSWRLTSTCCAGEWPGPSLRPYRKWGNVRQVAVLLGMGRDMGQNGNRVQRIGSFKTVVSWYQCWTVRMNPAHCLTRLMHYLPLGSW